MMEAIAIVGPTAVGKSRAAMRIAAARGAEIVSIDSRQVYRRLDIGTSKPSRLDREKIRHYMLDLLELDEKTDANWFADEARAAIGEILSRRKVPLLVGGSGLYLRAVLEGLFYIDISPLERKEFASAVSGAETADLYKRLEKADRESAARIHPNDRYRIVRALEVSLLTGLTLSEHFARQKRKGSRGSRLPAVKIGLNLPRRILHERINLRTMEMLESGWPAEVESLLGSGVDPGSYGMKTLGYPEVVDLVRGRKSYSETAERISAKTRQYAKSQLTWFRKERDVTWLDPEAADPLDEITKLLDRTLDN